MVATTERVYPGMLHPVHNILLTGAIPLFLGALLSDIAYANSYQIQWANFASWLIAGALVFTGFALLCAIIDWFRLRRPYKPSCVYPLLLAATWILGFINALIHAKDAWASMPAGLILSVVVFVLIAIAAWFGLNGVRAGGEK